MKKLFIILSVFLSVGLSAQLMSGGKILNSNPWTEIPNDTSYYQSGTGTYVNGVNYIECTSAGTIYLNNDQAYGTWEFDIYKLDVNSIVVDFIRNTLASNFSGYRLFISDTEFMQFARITSGSGVAIMKSSSSYIAHSTTYCIKITRSFSGIMTGFIKGGVFTDFTLIDASAVGTNPFSAVPHNTSSFTMFDLDVGDRIGGIRYKRTISDSNNALITQ